jgi:hypothetical protein
MGNAEFKSDLAPADLVRDLALAQEARKRRFASIIRFVRRYEASGPAKDVMGKSAATIVSASCSSSTKGSAKSSA